MNDNNLSALERQREYIANLEKITGYKPSRIAKDAGVHHSTITKFLKEDHSTELSTPVLRKIGKATGIYYEEDGAPQEVEIVGVISAGPLSDAFENDLGSITFQSTKEGLYALIVGGDSMDKFAKDGSIVILEPYCGAGDGSDIHRKVVHARLNDEATLKCFDFDTQSLQPDSCSSKHKTHLLRDGWEICGVVIGKYEAM